MSGFGGTYLPVLQAQEVFLQTFDVLIIVIISVRF